MIRNSTQVTGQLIALTLAICIAAAGMPPVLAAPEAARSTFEWMRAGGQAAPLSAARIDSVRSKSIRLQLSSDPRKQERGIRLSLLVDIFNATSPAERHAATRRLPARVVESTPPDGRAGVIKTVIAGGEARVSLFVPAPATRSSAPEFEEQPTSGPSAESAAAAVRADDCTFEGWTGVCATPEEIEDALLVIAACEVENEYAQNEYDATTAEIDAFCAQNPWACEALPDGELVLSGPSACTEAFGSCSSKGWTAFGSVLAAVGAASYAVIVAAAVVVPPAGAIVAVVTVAVGTTIGAAAASIEYISCKTALIYTLLGDRPSKVFELIR